MSSDEIARAFDRFWGADQGEGGFGLGLAIVQRLVHADGGEIELQPRADGGLEAIVRLPVASEAPHAR
jgi:signal transduction histidine kinase